MRGRLLAGVLVGALLGACGTPTEEVTSGSTTTAGAVDGWEQLPASPLSPRGGPVLVDLGGRMLVLGGDSHPGCHDTISMEAEPAPEDAAAPTSGGSQEDERTSGPAVLRTSSAASCAAPQRETRLRDGAIYDLATQKWTEIAEAPVPVSYSSSAVIGEMLYLWVAGGFVNPGQVLLTYDIDADRWDEMEMPAELEESYGVRLVAAGSTLLLYEPFADEHGRRDWLYDITEGTWSNLPPDPLKPSHDRQLFWAEDRWIILGPDTMTPLDEDRSPVQRAAVLDPDSAAWRRLPDSEILGTMGWSYSGRMIVSGQLGATDGGSSYGRSYPYGGLLDPKSGEWSSLPDGPPARQDDCGRRQSTAGQIHQVDGDAIVVYDDWALHVGDRRWESVPCNPERPDYAFSAEFVGDRLVTWGGYDTVAEPGQFPTDYEFSNEGWMWRSAA